MHKDKFQKIIGLFFLFAVLLNFPFVGLFNKQYNLYGFPLIYVYIFSVWFIMIILMAWVVEKRNK